MASQPPIPGTPVDEPPFEPGDPTPPRPSEPVVAPDGVAEPGTDPLHEGP